MPDILAFIQVLVEKGYAYESSGDVYYRTRKFENYGKLSDQSIDELEVGASQRTGEEQQQKEDPLDLLYGNKQNLARFLGIHHGAKGVPVGTSSVPSWRQNI